MRCSTSRDDAAGEDRLHSRARHRRAPKRIGELIDAGMSVARLNFSHGSHEDHARTLQIVRAEADRARSARSPSCSISRARRSASARFADGQVELKPGAEFTITTDPSVIGDSKRVSTTYAGIVRRRQGGRPDPARRRLPVARGDRGRGPRGQHGRGHRRHAQEQQGHQPARRRGLGAGALREGPHRYRRSRCVTASTTSRCRSSAAPRTCIEAKRLLTVDQVSIPVIAKIEKPQALERLEEIIDAADGVMVARGDLGVELGPEKVPLWQKRIIEETNRRGKIVITATQMLESMITQPAADPRGGLRRRQRGARRHRRADAVGRDRVRRAPDRGGAHDGADHRRDRAQRVLPRGNFEQRRHRARRVGQRDRPRRGAPPRSAMKLQTIVAVSDSGGAAG